MVGCSQHRYWPLPLLELSGLGGAGGLPRSLGSRVEAYPFQPHQVGKWSGTIAGRTKIL